MSADYHNLANGSLTQDWSNLGLITTNDNWGGVPSIEGFLGDTNSGSPTGVDPRTITVSGTTLDVIANQANPNTQTAGGVAEFHIADPTVALNGSGTADTPYLAFYLDATSRQNVRVQFNARDIDGSGDNSVQQLAVQYRIGSGAWTNVPGGYLADASGGPNLATLVTPVDVTLPAEANGASQLQVRVLTTNAPSNDEWIGIDDIVISSEHGAVVTTPRVNLSVSGNVAIEASSAQLTITATTTAPVAAAQTVQIAVSGSGISTGDYYLSKTTITIPAGASSGSVTFTVADDARVEGAETAVVAITGVSGGLELGATTSQSITIEDNTQSLLTKVGGAAVATAAEIPAFDPGSDRLYVVAASVVDVFTVGADGSLTPAGQVGPGFVVPAGMTAAPNSVAAKNGVIAVAYELKDAAGAHANGRVSFFNAADGSFLNSLEVGALPDMLTFTPDGSRLLVANEGEPNSYNQANSVDPEGSVNIIDLSAGVAAATVQTAGFGAFNSQMDALRAAGVRLFGPNTTVAQDLEPEYISITPDGTTALVTLQENNAIARVDIATATVTSITALGTKDFNLAGQGIDASDRDGSGGSTALNIANWRVQGLYQPDAITNFTVGGQTYFITANEGDARDYTGFNEEARVKDGSYVLDSTAYPDAAALKLDANLGRLTVTDAPGASGDTDNDGDIDVITAFGARSFTIWSSDGARVFDSGDMLERITAAQAPTLFNSDGTAATFDSRSDNKGPEPESVITGEVGGRIYAFVGLERVGDIVVFDVTNPAAPTFLQYINTPEDIAPEGLIFVSAAGSPTGKPLLITANEASNTVAVFEVATPLRIADIQGAGHISPLLASATDRAGVREVPGIVTAVASNGFYMQDPTPDDNDATSDAIFVFTNSAPSVGAGAAVLVSGTVSEFRPGNATTLTVTQISHNAAVEPLLVLPWTDAPATPIVPLVLGTDRTPPTQHINDDFGPGVGNVETGGDFDPVGEGIDFWESLEGMLVSIPGAVAVSPTAHFGDNEEIWVLAHGGAGATGLTERGGIAVSAGDFNPERIQIDDLHTVTLLPEVDVGARFADMTGVVNYNFGNYEVLLPAAPVVTEASSLQRETTTLTGSAGALTVGTFNVENLDPGDTSFAAIAAAIKNNLASPDILCVEEIQDNNGATNNGVVDASVTFQTLIDAIVAAGGPRYEYRQINPVNGADGGEPGGNIRTGFLFNPDRVDFVEGSLQRLVDPVGGAFDNSRKPLVGVFTFSGEEITVIGNHFNSKGGDQPLFGTNQPPVLSSEVQRMKQATIVADYVDGLLSEDAGASVIVLGDLNDFEFSAPIGVLEAAGLTSLVETLPANQRYSYNFEGNAQVLDHIMVSPGLLAATSGFDVVHMNSEFSDQLSDHDPSVARFGIAEQKVLVGNAGMNTLVGGAGHDTITGLGGRDVLTGNAGDDRFVYRSLVDAGDRITDFQPGSDLLVVGQLLASINYTGSDPIADKTLLLLSQGGRTYAMYDTDGQAGPAIARPLVELAGVSLQQLENQTVFDTTMPIGA